MIAPEKSPPFGQLKLFLIGIFLLQFSGGLSAGFQVTPLKMIFDAASNTASLTLTNEGTEPLRVQAEAMEWAQDSTGKDSYNPTSEIIFFPKILAIEPGAKRIIRVGYQGPPPQAIEKSYRLFVAEIPVSTPGEAVMKIALRVSIPVFARPLNSHLDWELGSADIERQGIKVPVINKGNQYLSVGTIVVSGQNQQGEEVFSLEKKGWYVLAGLQRNFILPVDPEQCARATTLDVTVTLNDRTHNQELEIKPADCALIELPKRRQAK